MEDSFSSICDNERAFVRLFGRNLGCAANIVLLENEENKFSCRRREYTKNPGPVLITATYNQLRVFYCRSGLS